MRRQLFSLIACSMLAPTSAAFAQGTTPAADPPGSVVNGDAPSGQVRSWISRFSDESALALTVANNPAGANIIGTLRTYKSDGEGGLLKESFSIDPDEGSGPVAPTSIDVIPVRLEARTDANLRFPSWDIVYDDRDPVFTKITLPAGSPKLVLGWVAYKAGRVDRGQSTVLLRTDRKKVIGKPSNPCDAPPADDVGEEELVSASTKYANAPGVSLPPLTATQSGPVD